jgi:anthranilate synthase component 1
MTSGGITTAPSFDEAGALSASYSVIPISHRFLDDIETPVSAYLKLRQPSGCFLLESAEQGRRQGRYSFLGVQAWENIRLHGDRVTIRRNGTDIHRDLKAEGLDPFNFMAEYLAQYRAPRIEGLPPFVGGAVGYFGYDCVRHVVDLPDAPPDDLGLPDMAFMLTDVIVVFDHLRHTITLITNIFRDEEPHFEKAYRAAVARLAEVKERLKAPVPPPGWTLGRAAALEEASTSNFPKAEFTRSVADVVERIRSGEVSQVVLSQRFERPVDVCGFSIYRGLRTVNPSPYMYHIAFSDFEVVGSSPEPLLTVVGDVVETRPIAGTRPRGAGAEEDAALAGEMLADEKERSEHLMLVEMSREDLERVCHEGSVEVAGLMEVERYSHVMHMVSSATGELRDGITGVEALRAVFPAGTVSGAPRVAAMELIDAAEPVRRGPYGGAIAYLSYTGDLDSCICIRTLLLRDGRAYVQAGAGIVAGSDPESEFMETVNKARAQFQAIEVAAMQPDWE